MSFFTAAVGVPFWLLAVGVGLPSILAFVFGLLFYRLWSNPEIKTLSKAVLNPDYYIVMDHTTYGYVRFHAAKLGKLTMEGPKQMGIKFIPRDEGHVERSANFRIVHTIHGHPYPIESETAYVVERCCAEIREAGLPLSINVLDALFRAELDREKMCGYVKYKKQSQKMDEDGNPMFKDEIQTDEDGNTVYQDEQLFDEDGKPIFEGVEDYDEDGNPHTIYVPQTHRVPVVVQVPVMEEVEETIQKELTEKEFEILEDIKDKLEHTFVGYDHLGGSIFAYQHVSDVVSLAASIVSTDVQALVDNAAREALLKSKKKSADLMMYAIVFCIICVGAIVLLKGLEVI